MKRYKVLTIFASIGAASFVGGRIFGAPVQPPQPVTITVHTRAETRVVHASYVDMSFEGGAVQLEYSTDRIFCNPFESKWGCYLVLP